MSTVRHTARDMKVLLVLSLYGSQSHAMSPSATSLAQGNDIANLTEHLASRDLAGVQTFQWIFNFARLHNDKWIN